MVEEKDGPVWTHLASDLGIKPDHFHILEKRGRDRKAIEAELKTIDVFKKKYWDGRVFGNTFLEEGGPDTVKSGVVQFALGLSVASIDIERMTNTNKSGVQEGKDRGMAPLGYRIVRHGVYCMPFFVNPSAAFKSGCTTKDIELLCQLIPLAYSHTASYVRPFVGIRHAWFVEHKSSLGSCSDFDLLDELRPKKKIAPERPSSSWDDYEAPTELSERLSARVKPLRDLVREFEDDHSTQAAGHRARSKKNIGPQAYSEHVLNVTNHAVKNAENAARFSPVLGSLLVVVVRPAAKSHDLGKLDSDNQEVLRYHPTWPLPVNHVDAGVAHLLNQRSMDIDRRLAALLIYAHHIGLPSLIEEENRGQNFLRTREQGADDEPLRERTDKRLESYIADHNLAVPDLLELDAIPFEKRISQLQFRVALSCLVDADHTDTARHYGDYLETDAPSIQAAERLNLLNAYVENLAGGKKDDRNRLRQEIYQQCRDADPSNSLWECDSPVGTGKTTAVMAHLLNAAKAKGLRRIFVVLPFTNIIDQAVGVYRRALVLPGEDPESVVAAHHHKAEYAKVPSRHLAALRRPDCRYDRRAVLRNLGVKLNRRTSKIARTDWFRYIHRRIPRISSAQALALRVGNGSRSFLPPGGVISFWVRGRSTGFGRSPKSERPH